MDPPRLPPFLVAGVDDMQHVPKVEAKGLAQEPAVLGLVVVKQGPAGQRALGQSLAEGPPPGAQPRGRGRAYSGEWLPALPRAQGSEPPKSSEGPKLRRGSQSPQPITRSVHAVSAIGQALGSVQFLRSHRNPPGEPSAKHKQLSH